MIVDTTNHQRLLWAVRVRWLVIGGFLGLALIAYAAGVFVSVRACVWAAAVGAVLNAVNQWCVVRGRFVRGVTALAIPGDVILITFVSIATGGVQSAFVMMYVVQVLATAMLVGLPAAAASALASVGGLAIALLLRPDPAIGSSLILTGAVQLGRYQLVWTGFLLYCLGLLAFLGGYIGEQLRTSERDLAVQNARLRDTLDSLQIAHTELAGAYERLKVAESQLVHSEKMRSLGQFVAGIAHELNNPISFVAANIEHIERHLGALQRLVDAEPDAIPAGVERARTVHFLTDLPDILRDCADGVRRAKEILDGLRLFSRRDAGEHWQLSDVHAGLERSLALVRHRLGRQVTVERMYGEIPLIVCLPSQLDQVFVNLLVNATDAVGDAGRITVRTAVVPGPAGGPRMGPHVAITVGDNGVGIASDMIGQIFDPFFTTKDPGHGTGLGLSVSYGIVVRHGGTITVESSPGCGSAFTVLLPVQPAEDSPRPA